MGGPNRQEDLDFVKREPVIIYGQDKGHALFPKGEGLWQVEYMVGNNTYRKTIHESHLEWVEKAE